MPENKPMRLGDRLISVGKITEEQLKDGLSYQKDHNVPLGKALESLGYISEQEIIEALSKQLGVPYTALLEEASEKLLKVLNLEEILKYLLENAKVGIEAEGGTVYIVDKNKKEIYSKVMSESSSREIRLPFGSGIAGLVAQNGEVIRIDNAYKDGRFNKVNDILTGFRTRNILCAPIENNKNEIVGVFQLVNKKDENFNDADVKFLKSLSNFSATAIQLAKLNQEMVEKKRLETQLNIAREMQLKLFPKSIPKLPGYEIFGTNGSCEEVCGDYYDFFPIEKNKWILAIGDVSGKGIPASFIMAILQSHLKAVSKFGYPLEEVMNLLNNYIVDNSTPEKFVTFIFGVLDLKENTFTYVNAGHNPPYLINKNGDVSLLKSSGPIIGVFPDLDYECHTLKLQDGDLLFCFTDGVTECFNNEEEEYGEERLEKFLVENKELDTKTIVEKSLLELEIFAEGAKPSDDITYLALKKI